MLADGVAAAAQLALDREEPRPVAGAEVVADAPPPQPAQVPPQQPAAQNPPAPAMSRAEWISLLVRAGVSFFWGCVLIAVLLLLPWRDALACVQSTLGLASSSVELAGVVLSSMHNLTAEVGMLSTEMVRGTRTLIEDVWRGVEFTDLVTTAVGNTIVARDTDSLLSWLERNISSLPSSLFEQWQAQITAFADTGIIHLDLAHSHLDINAGRFTFAQGQLEKLPHNKIGLRFVMIAVRFGLIWSNPLWEVLEQNASSEVGFVVASLTAALHQHPVYVQYIGGQRQWPITTTSWR